MSGQSGVVLNAITTGQLATFTVPIPLAGTYKIKVGVKTTSKSGMFQLAIDGANRFRRTSSD